MQNFGAHSARCRRSRKSHPTIPQSRNLSDRTDPMEHLRRLREGGCSDSTSSPVRIVDRSSVTLIENQYHRETRLHQAEQFESVLRAARVGAEWAWSRLYEDLAPVLYGYVRRQGAIDPDDLVSETWLHVARNIPRFEGDEASFRSWIFTIAHHRIIDERRRMARRPVVPLGDEDESNIPSAFGQSAEDMALARIRQDEISHHLDLLTPDQREVVILRFMVGFGLTEIARIMGKSAGAVNATQRRALKRLKKKMILDGTFSPKSSVTEVK